MACTDLRGGRSRHLVRALGRKLGYFWRPPGWTHDGSRDTSDAIRQRWLDRQLVHPAE